MAVKWLTIFHNSLLIVPSWKEHAADMMLDESKSGQTMSVISTRLSIYPVSSVAGPEWTRYNFHCPRLLNQPPAAKAF